MNGERLYLSEYVKLIFETDDLTDASPATVSRCVSAISIQCTQWSVTSSANMSDQLKMRLWVPNVECSWPFQGVVYMDESVLGWRPLAEAWLANRSPQESHVRFY